MSESLATQADKMIAAEGNRLISLRSRLEDLLLAANDGVVAEVLRREIETLFDWMAKLYEFTKVQEAPSAYGGGSLTQPSTESDFPVIYCACSEILQESKRILHRYSEYSHCEDYRDIEKIIYAIEAKVAAIQALDAIALAFFREVRELGDRPNNSTRLLERSMNGISQFRYILETHHEFVSVEVEIAM